MSKKRRIDRRNGQRDALIRKMPGQPKRSISGPPTSGPAPSANAAVARPDTHGLCSRPRVGKGRAKRR
jgi:hypothetical protein